VKRLSARGRSPTAQVVVAAWAQAATTSLSITTPKNTRHQACPSRRRHVHNPIRPHSSNQTTTRVSPPISRTTNHPPNILFTDMWDPQYLHDPSLFNRRPRDRDPTCSEGMISPTLSTGPDRQTDTPPRHCRVRPTSSSLSPPSPPSPASSPAALRLCGVQRVGVLFLTTSPIAVSHLAPLS
jgi:hypothetical protein